MSYSLGQTTTTSAPVPPPVNWPVVLGWVGIIGATSAILWGAVTMPPKRRLATNRRRSRRSSRRARRVRSNGGYELVYATGGHGGPYATQAEAERSAERLLAGGRDSWIAVVPANEIVDLNEAHAVATLYRGGMSPSAFAGWHRGRTRLPSARMVRNARLSHPARLSIRSKHSGAARLSWAPQWRFKRNPRGRLGGSKEMALWEAMELARQQPVADQGAWSLLSPAAKAKIKALPDGFYSYGMGKKGPALRGFHTEDLSGVMMSTRIAASKSHEPHWLLQVRKHHPVVIRMFDDNGRSVYRVEEFAKVSQAVAVPVRARRSRSASARR